jgi:mono/diheme cytochrome c family protein
MRFNVAVISVSLIFFQYDRDKSDGIDRDQGLSLCILDSSQSCYWGESVRTGLLNKIHVGRYFLAFAICNLIFFGSAYAQMDPRQQRGFTLAKANCARCHSVDKVTASPLTLAPPFRELHHRYPVESLEEALGEGIVTGHPNMPEFRLDPGQVGDLISYLKWLER